MLIWMKYFVQFIYEKISRSMRSTNSSQYYRHHHHPRIIAKVCKQCPELFDIHLSEHTLYFINTHDDDDDDEFLFSYYLSLFFFLKINFMVMRTRFELCAMNWKWNKASNLCTVAYISLFQRFIKLVVHSLWNIVFLLLLL